MNHTLTEPELHVLTTLFGADFWHLATQTDAEFRIARDASGLSLERMAGKETSAHGRNRCENPSEALRAGQPRHPRASSMTPGDHRQLVSSSFETPWFIRRQLKRQLNSFNRA